VGIGTHTNAVRQSGKPIHLEGKKVGGECRTHPMYMATIESAIIK